MPFQWRITFGHRHRSDYNPAQVSYAEGATSPVLRSDLRSCNRFSGELPEDLSGKVGFHSCSVPSEGTPTAVPIFHFPVLSAILS